MAASLGPAVAQELVAVSRPSSHPARVAQPDGLRVAFGFLELSALLGHERTIPDYLAALAEDIGRDGELRQPIVVDRHSLVILDGHHRTAALRLLGCVYIPTYLVDYLHPAITVEPRRPGIPVSKESVVRTGLSGQLYPPKTSKHTVPGLPSRPTPLALLRG